MRICISLLLNHRVFINANVHSRSRAILGRVQPGTEPECPNISLASLVLSVPDTHIRFKLAKMPSAFRLSASKSNDLNSFFRLNSEPDPIPGQVRRALLVESIDPCRLDGILV